jgi:hypothetical protein
MAIFRRRDRDAPELGCTAGTHLLSSRAEVVGKIWVGPISAMNTLPASQAVGYQRFATGAR